MTKIFWGLVMAHLDILWKGYDVLPDFIGYLLIFFGARELRAAGRRFDAVAVCAAIMTAASLLLTGAGVTGHLPTAGWGSEAVHLADCALTAVLELFFLAGVKQAERTYQTELNDAMFFRAWLFTWMFAVFGSVLRVMENDIFAIMTTATTGLLTIWLFYALWQIRKNYGYLRMQQAFERNRDAS